MDVLDSQGDEALVEVHQGCYCSFTSKYHVKKVVDKKRKEGSIDSEEPPTARIRRSQVKEFHLKKQCLFCAASCEPVNPKPPDRWDRVVQCERKVVKDAPPFKAVVLHYCDDRNDVWSREIAMRCHGADDLSAAEAQYHVRC